MRTSATTNNSRARGFSLFEIMVVVALIALLAAVAVPTLTDRGRGELRKQGDRLSGLLEQLNEQSLFLGQMLATRLKSDQVQPLRYDHEEGDFVAMQGEGELSALELPDGIRLEWRLEQTDERQGPELRDAVSSRLDDGESDTRERGEREQADDSDEPDDNGDDESPPQLFFFPSGEVTPITLWLRRSGAEGEGLEFKLNSLGRVERPSGEDEGNER